MREGEICALKREDINFEENYIKVTHNMFEKSRELILEETKTAASKAIVAMTKELKNKLLNVQEHQKRLRLHTDLYAPERMADP